MYASSSVYIYAVVDGNVMENKLLKIGDEVRFTSHFFDGRLVGSGIGIVSSIRELDYTVLCRFSTSTTREYIVTIPGKRQGGHSLDTISLIEEEN